ncbi:N-acyl amino acid synthase, PEP-CTERM/exosortase system-associated [Tritonibacter multivorans]|uniref:L-ornithine N(alpha)-acyltransferase n=1 Tax=Tritonibacter multivorans TaxID=928856 RepID=A0A0P1GKC1_9RHOB|nr:GNAT family N-acyltransferase [Tritonibacter multivorans]MDA7421446.1 GNAT family N-acetyltransferase [Tritonibacter multivorans]CUH82388.1 N-acyl amino acid synthase, PEP-CTERM/exosortase system-associated [Tritonibacter multivorans]SFC99659.1 ornithine-acyl[acyl carrier protein] N-acyltransferase [Tritonibacter multivorans]
MQDEAAGFTVKIAETEDELRAAQALRYDVFVRELGGDGDLVDHEQGLERDRFDPFFDHMIVKDDATGQTIGVYRLLRDDQAAEMGRFYSEDEYDLSPLRASGRKLLELGRSCLHPDYRGGAAMFHLWSGLADYVAEHKIEILFGVASFHGTDPVPLANSLSMLHHNHLAPADLRVRSKVFQPMNLVAPDALDRRQAMIDTPALIKAYLRLGGYVGEGAFVDHAFNTTDICLILDTEKMSTRQSRLYGQGPGKRGA